MDFMPSLFSLDHRVRPPQHVRRNYDTKLLGGFQIDDKVKLCRLFNRKIRRSRTLQDLVHVDCGAPEYVRKVCGIRHKIAGLYIHPLVVHRWEPTFGREVDYPLSVGIEE